MNFLNKSSVLLLTGALLCIASAAVLAEVSETPEVLVPEQQVEEPKAPEVETMVAPEVEAPAIDEPAQTEEPEENQPRRLVGQRAKVFKYPVVYNADNDSMVVEMRCKDSKSPSSPEDRQVIAEWIANFKSIFISFLTSITAPGFNKDESLDKEISAVVESLKTATANIVESDIYKSNRELRQQVKAAFDLLQSRVPLTRDRVSELKEEKFDIDDIQIWADVLSATFTKFSNPDLTCGLASVSMGGNHIKNILHWYEDMLSQMGLEKAVEGIKKAAYDIKQTL